MNSEQKIQFKRSKVIWSKQELLMNNRPFPIPNTEVPFKLVNLVKLRRFVFGTFLEHLNSQQNQDEDLNTNKLSMFEFDSKSFKPAEIKHFNSDNDFAEDILSLLVKAVHTENVIREDFVFRNIFALKFINLPMTILDSGLRKYKSLQMLVLSGNLIKHLRGCNFPRNLQYLELFANDITDLKDFTVRAPKKLIYLGLQRNKIYDGSHLHLMGSCGNFDYVRCLDVADNDICDLACTLAALKKLSSLRYLHLQGNPCAVLCVYKDAVLKELPELVYLDNTEILPEDRELFKFAVDMVAAVVFNCHWIIGLPPPPKQKGVIHKFYIEVNMPLLEEVVEPENETTEEPETPNEPKLPGKSKNLKKGGKIKASKGSSKSSKKKSKKSKKKVSIYDAKDEYESERRARVKNTSFKTDRFSWTKVIQLPEEALVIQSSDGNLADIRDTFRSSVNVKLIYLQIQIPSKQTSKKKKPKKKKGNKKAKKEKKKKGEKDKKHNEKEMEILAEPAPIVEEKPPEEVILKKITIANFNCDLHSINWSDKSVDFFWAQNPQTNPNAAEVRGSLRMINYKGGSKNKPIVEGTESVYPPVPLPKFFNIQVGFGLKRSYYQDI